MVRVSNTCATRFWTHEDSSPRPDLPIIRTSSVRLDSTGPTMRPFAYYFVFGVLLAHGLMPQSAVRVQIAFSPGMARVITSLDADWRFLKGDPAGAEAPSFDDTSGVR